MKNEELIQTLREVNKLAKKAWELSTKEAYAIETLVWALSEHAYAVQNACEELPF